MDNKQPIIITPQIILNGNGIMVGLLNVEDKIESAFYYIVKHWWVYFLYKYPDGHDNMQE